MSDKCYKLCTLIEFLALQKKYTELEEKSRDKEGIMAIRMSNLCSLIITVLQEVNRKMSMELDNLRSY